jgi:hypothetical protein
MVEMDSHSSVEELVLGFCKYGGQTLSSLKQHTSRPAVAYQVLKADCTTCSYILPNT